MGKRKVENLDLLTVLPMVTEMGRYLEKGMGHQMALLMAYHLEKRMELWRVHLMESQWVHCIADRRALLVIESSQGLSDLHSHSGQKQTLS